MDRLALGVFLKVGGSGAGVRLGLPPDFAEEGALVGFLGGGVLVALRAGEEVEALLRAGRGDVEEAAGFDVLGFLLELADVVVSGLFIGASFIYWCKQEFCI